MDEGTLQNLIQDGFFGKNLSTSDIALIRQAYGFKAPQVPQPKLLRSENLTLVKSRRLGGRKKALLLVLYEHRGYAYTERDLIKEVYGSMSPSNSASASRALKTLVSEGLVETCKDITTRIFRISQRGISFVEERNLT